jgi:hypothetical protein
MPVMDDRRLNEDSASVESSFSHPTKENEMEHFASELTDNQGFRRALMLLVLEIHEHE